MSMKLIRAMQQSIAQDIEMPYNEVLKVKDILERCFVAQPLGGNYRDNIYLSPSTENICAFVAGLRPHENYKIDDCNLNIILTTLGNFLDKVPDQEYCVEELHPCIIPMQLGEVEIPEVEKVTAEEYEDLFDYIDYIEMKSNIDLKL